MLINYLNFMESQRSSNQAFGKRQKRSLNDFSSKYPSSKLSSPLKNNVVSKTANAYFHQETSSSGKNVKNFLINKVSHLKQLDMEYISTLPKLHQDVGEMFCNSVHSTENADHSKTNNQIVNMNVGVNIIADDNGNSSIAPNNFNETETLKANRPSSSTDIETSQENNNKVVYCSLDFIVEHQLSKLSKTEDWVIKLVGSLNLYEKQILISAPR